LGCPTRWWLDQQGIHVVVPANTNMAAAADARAQATAGNALTVGRCAHTVCPGQGKAAWSARLDTKVVGMTGLTSDDHYGTPEQARQAHRCAFPGNPINAVVGRQWSGKDDGPGGKTVFL
jgi:hypothetical protein